MTCTTIDPFDINGENKLAAESVELRKDIIRYHAKNPKSLFILSNSGGKDSQFMYNVVKNIVKNPKQIIVIHANLGEVEHNGVITHIESMTDDDHEIVVLKNEKYDFIDLVLYRGMFPGSNARFCTSSLKTSPIDKFIRKIANERGATTVFNIVGLRSLESRQRSLKNPLFINERLTTKTRLVMDWYPIFEYSEEQVFQGIAEAGQKPHPIYWQKDVDGVTENSRLSCRFCIVANINDLRNAAIRYRDHYHQMVALERLIGHTMFGKSKTIQTEVQYNKNDRVHGGIVTSSDKNTNKRPIFPFKTKLFIPTPLNEKIGIEIDEYLVSVHMADLKERREKILERVAQEAKEKAIEKANDIKSGQKKGKKAPARDPRTIEMF